MDDLSWLLVATKPQAEFVAREHLIKQGFQACLPRAIVRKRKQGGWQQVVEPMFPGYVFAGVVLGEQDITPIRSTQGCRQLVRFGTHLVPVPDGLIEQFMDHEKLPLEITQNFKRGQVVRVESGAFSGLSAIFEQSKGGGRVELLFTILGGVRSVQVPVRDVSAL